MNKGLSARACIKCGEYKCATEYSSVRATACFECIQKAAMDRRLRYTYGITVEDYNAMFIEQRGRCAICGKHQSSLNRVLCVDHNHDTGKVRALLCNGCNTLVGAADNPLIDVVLAYVKLHAE